MDEYITNETHFSQTIQFDDIKKVKIELLQIINAIISKNLWHQEQAAQILKTDQSSVSNIKYFKIKYFALERLFLLLLRLNCHVKLVISSQKITSVIVVQLDTTEIKIALMCLITDIITQNGWSQEKAGEVLQIDQGKVSNIKKLKITYFSIKRLINSLILLGCKIEIIIERANHCGI